MRKLPARDSRWDLRVRKGTYMLPPILFHHVVTALQIIFGF
jgi:hypothetical protein